MYVELGWKEAIKSEAAKRCFPRDKSLGSAQGLPTITSNTRASRLPFSNHRPSIVAYPSRKEPKASMDFDDQLIAQLNAPEHRTPTPPPPPQDATTTSTPPTNPTTTPSLPRPTMTAKDGESYYIKPIPSGLRAPSLSDLMQLCHTHTLHHGFDVVKKPASNPPRPKMGKRQSSPTLRIINGTSLAYWVGSRRTPDI